MQTFSADGFNSNLSLISGSSVCERNLYKTLKNTVPVISAAIYKIIRLMGRFQIQTGSENLDRDINRFLKNIRVNACETGIESFLSCYLEQMLVYGTAVGEIVLDRKHKNISALYNASLDDVQIISDGNPLDIKICTQNSDGSLSPVKYPALVLCSSIMPEPGQIYGTSVLKGLPFIGQILMKIFNAVGTNWDRIGNVRFAVSYKPNENERSFSKERAKTIADEWSKAMKSSSPKDFITVGDVSIKVIGAASLPVKLPSNAMGIDDNYLPWLHSFYLFDKCITRIQGASKTNWLQQSRNIQLWGVDIRFQDAFQLGAKHNATRHLSVIDALLSYPVASSKQLLFLHIIQTKRKHAAQMAHAVRPVQLIKIKDYLGIAIRKEREAFGLQFLLQLQIIVYLAIANQGQRLVVIEKRLLSILQTDNGQTDLSHSAMLVRPSAFVFRSAIAHLIIHLLNLRQIIFCDSRIAIHH